MDRLKYIKLENEDGSYSSSIPLAVDSNYVSVNGNTLTNELNNKASNSSIVNLQNQINSLASGSPLVASSTSGMIDTTRIYVNTSDGYVYYYDGTQWVQGWVYQATAIGDNAVDFDSLDIKLQDIIDLEMPTYTIEQNTYINPSNGSKGTAQQTNLTSPIELKKNHTIYLTGNTLSTVCALALYNENNTYTPIEAGVGNVEHLYSYTANKDCYIVCGYTSINSIYTCIKEEGILNYVNEVDELVNNITDSKKPTYTIETDTFINPSTNAKSTAQNTSLTSPIELKSGHTIEMVSKCYTTVSALAIYYPSTNTYQAIERGKGDSAFSTYKYTTNVDCYIVCGFKNNTELSIKTYVNVLDNIVNINNEIKELNKRENVLTMFDNISCFGDSLTYCQVYTSNDTSRQAYKTWPNILGIRTGAEIDVKATPGFSATHWWGNYKNQIVSKTNQLCIIYLGHNQGLTDSVATDCAGDDPSQYADTNTGNYGKIINKCLSVDAKVVLVKCWGVGGGGNLADTNKAIEDLATKFNVAWVKNEQLIGNVYHYWPNKQGTNSHYNDFGYSVFCNKLIENISNMSDEFIERIYPQ